MARLDVIEMFHGIAFPGHVHTQDSLQHALKFPFQESDVLIVTYPKSGKTRAEPCDGKQGVVNLEPLIQDHEILLKPLKVL